MSYWITPPLSIQKVTIREPILIVNDLENFQVLLSEFLKAKLNRIICTRSYQYVQQTKKIEGHLLYSGRKIFNTLTSLLIKEGK